MAKSPGAFRTIAEVARDLDLPQHVLRFWETKFLQIRPLKRRGGRRYYRPEDVALLRRIRSLLYVEGYTIRGVQKVLQEGGSKERPEPPAAVTPAPADGAGGGSTSPAKIARSEERRSSPPRSSGDADPRAGRDPGAADSRAHAVHSEEPRTGEPKAVNHRAADARRTLKSELTAVIDELCALRDLLRSSER